MATKDNWQDIIRTNYTYLLVNITITDELPGALLSETIFTPLQLKSFSDTKDTVAAIDKMLSCLQKKGFDSFQRFCKVLESSDQGSVVRDYLSAIRVKENPMIGTDSVDLAENRPIPLAKIKCLKRHMNDLLINIRFDSELLAKLVEARSWTTIMLTRLRDIPEETLRTRLFLQHLPGMSEKQYDDFCAALVENGQGHIVIQYLTPAAETSQNKKSLKRETPEGASCKESLKYPNPSPAAATAGIPCDIPMRERISVEDIVFSPCSEDFRKCINEKVRLEAAYKCDSHPRGRAIIINNQYFTRENLEYRHGADKDSCNLETFFNRLQFDTVVHPNKTAEEITAILRKESQENCHKDYDIFVLFLLSHGIQGEIYGSDGMPVKTKEIMQLFDGKNCPNLVGKPKLIFIQACQGNLKTTGITAGLSDMTVTDAPVGPAWNITAKNVVEKLKEKEDFNISLPLESLSIVQSDAIPDVCKIHEMADMALFYATVEGYAAWRRRDIGSLFVQCMIDVFLSSAHEKDLMSMFTEVFRALHNYEVQAGNESYKQIGEKRDTLRKMVYLLPG